MVRKTHPNNTRVSEDHAKTPQNSHYPSIEEKISVQSTGCPWLIVFT